MDVRPIDMNGMIQSTPEANVSKTRADIQPELQQMNLMAEAREQGAVDQERVIEQENITEDNMNPDEGNGAGYQGRGKGKKKKEGGASKIPGRVIKKNSFGSFDMSV